MFFRENKIHFHVHDNASLYVYTYMCAMIKFYVNHYLVYSSRIPVEFQ
jgi:hypothetical protein